MKELVICDDGYQFKASPDGRLLASVSHDGTVDMDRVAIYETRHWQLLCNSRIKRVTSLAFSPDNQRLAILSEPEGRIHETEIFLLDTTFGHKLLTLPGPSLPRRDRLVFSSDGSTLSVCHTGSIRSWNAPDAPDAPLGWIRLDSRECTPH